MMNKVGLKLWRLIVPLIVILLTAAHCEKERADCHYRITFINQSDQVVYATRTSEEYYDSGFPNPLNSHDLYKINAGEASRGALFSRGCLEHQFTGKYSTDKMLIFVIDEEVLENTPWEQVKAERLFLKEYQLTLEDLQKMDWKITYTSD